MERQRIRMAVTVMAYPAISGRHGESVCLAGLRTDSLMQTEWVRLFPFKGRDLPGGLRISKWDEIELEVARPRPDHAPLPAPVPAAECVLGAGLRSTAEQCSGLAAHRQQCP